MTRIGTTLVQAARAAAREMVDAKRLLEGCAKRPITASADPQRFRSAANRLDTATEALRAAIDRANGEGKR